MEIYLNLLKEVLTSGEYRQDRTGTGTISLFGAQSRYDLRDGFPLITTKKVLFSSVVRELLWFLAGSTNIHDQNFTEHTKIWDAWADPDGNLGPIYGSQWRSWGGRGQDQIIGLITRLQQDPTSRRHIVSAWNVEDIPKMKLPPCHVLFQFYVQDNWLDCQLYQRSADLALGVPFNIASYALLMSMIAQDCNLQPRYFIHTLGDAHIYINHLDGVREQIKRTPLPPPRLVLAKKSTLEMKYEDVALEDYQHHPFIKFPIAV